MGVPRTYRKSQERVIASYTFTNLIEGDGSVVFYAGNGLDDSATSITLLKSQTFASHDIEYTTLTGVLTESFVKVAELNYDLSPSKTNQTIKGKAIIELTFAVKGHASTDVQGYIIGKLIRSRSGETIIGTGKSSTLDRDQATWDTKRTSLILDLTETKIKKDDVLRLSIEGWAKRDDTGGSYQGYIGWGQDPLDRDGTVIVPSTTANSTQLKIQIPFKIDL